MSGEVNNFFSIVIVGSGAGVASVVPAKLFRIGAGVPIYLTTIKVGDSSSTVTSLETGLPDEAVTFVVADFTADFTIGACTIGDTFVDAEDPGAVFLAGSTAIGATPGNARPGVTAEGTLELPVDVSGEDSGAMDAVA